MSKTATKILLGYSNFTAEQQDAISRLVEYDETIMVASKGFGKAAIAQTAAQELIEEGVLTRVLVIAPPKVCSLTWAAEHEKWEQLWAPGMADGIPASREDVIASNARIVVLSSELVDWFFNKYGSGHGFDGVVFDELTRWKAVGGKAFKAIRPHIGGFKWRVGLSATPVAEAGHHLYGQALLIDGGKALGRNKERFMAKYFVPDYSGYKFTPQYMAEARMAEALRDIVYVAESSEYEKSLPPLHEEIVHVKMNDRGVDAYEELANTMLLEDEDVEAANAAVLAGKLQQVASGFIYTDAGDTIHLHNCKYQQLDDLLQAINEPAMIVYQFRAELAILKAMLPDAMVLAENPKKSLDAWNSGRCRYLLVHPRSAGHGVNAQHGGRVMIQLAPIWSADLHDQVIGRIWRRGQTQRVTRYTLVADGTVDGVILQRLADKNLSESVLMDHLRAVASKKETPA